MIDQSTARTLISLKDKVDSLTERVKELEEAIRKHRDVKGHDRCKENDCDLWKLLSDTTEEDLSYKDLPMPCAFMEGCVDYCTDKSKGTYQGSLEYWFRHTINGIEYTTKGKRNLDEPS